MIEEKEEESKRQEHTCPKKIHGLAESRVMSADRQFGQSVAVARRGRSSSDNHLLLRPAGAYRVDLSRGPDTGGPQTHPAFYLPHGWFDDTPTRPDSLSDRSDIPLVTRGNIGAAIPADVEVCGDRLMTLGTFNIRARCTEIAAAFGAARFPRVASQVVATAWTSDDRRLSPHLPQ